VKLGVMQPYFFPYVGYFELIRKTDRWVVFDTVQYQRKHWMNRNRIHHPDDGWQYVSVPVSKFERFARIDQIRLHDVTHASERIVAQLEHYKGKAPNYEHVIDLVTRTFAGLQGESLVELNVRGLQLVCEAIGIEFRHEVLSQMELELPPVDHPGRWALEISDAMGATEYLNPPGGRDLFSAEEFEARGIGLSFTDLPGLRYDCAPYEFIESLSILDVLMWCDAKTVRSQLDR
jgi:hypothetical protein